MVVAKLLRTLIAGPRARHPDVDLDLCYVSSSPDPIIIATSGPSATYPQRAYRNNLETLTKFLNERHGEEWMIWEFRAEGTGYPDSAVGGRVWHFPWPDHHPPPFGLVPRVMASMRDWLKPVEGVSGWPNGGKGNNGNDGSSSQVKSISEESSLQGKSGSGGGSSESQRQSANHSSLPGEQGKPRATDGSKRVVVVHCKAGKGRSGTASCSYLISEEGWTKEAAVERFTERRMRPGWNQKGVSIPSQLRWLGYVERWKNGGKIYVERKVEVTEVHVWGLKNGVEVSVRGFIEEGKIIKVWHTFTDDEREVVRGKVGDFGFSEAVMDMINKPSSKPSSASGTPQNQSLDNLENKAATSSTHVPSSTASKLKAAAAKSKANRESASSELGSDQKASESSTGSTGTIIKTGSTDTDGCVESKPETVAANTPVAYPITSDGAPKVDPANSTTTPTAGTSTNAVANNTIMYTGADAVFRPKNPIFLDSNDINIDTERKTRGTYTFGLTTSVSHVWFNTFFEGNGPENNGRAATSGVFEIEWDKMDGVKGSSTRGQRAFEKLQVVWKVVDGEVGNVVREPTPGEEVKQAEPADWKGVKDKVKPVEGAGAGESSDEDDPGTVSHVGEVAVEGSK
ncbi:dual specificity phosphatase [Venturia nashicola]|nr:dual specificity phosphatase [Venturia nashicola]